MKKTIVIITIGLLIASLKLVFASDWVEQNNSYEISTASRLAVNHYYTSYSKTEWARTNPETGEPETTKNFRKSNWTSVSAIPASKNNSSSYRYKYTTTGDKTIKGKCTEGECKNETDEGTTEVY